MSRDWRQITLHQDLTIEENAVLKEDYLESVWKRARPPSGAFGWTMIVDQPDLKVISRDLEAAEKLRNPCYMIIYVPQKEV